MFSTLPLGILKLDFGHGTAGISDILEAIRLDYSADLLIVRVNTIMSVIQCNITEILPQNSHNLDVIQ